MATLNDFKLVSRISRRYFEDIGKASLKLNDLEKSRLGFYLFIMECVTNNRDLDILKECIIDTEFRKQIFKEGNNDLGIDAIYIDEEERKILLFNFKYRGSFKKEKAQELNDLIVSSKFLNVISSEEIEGLDKTTQKYLKKIIEKNNSDEEWNIEIFLVSNENKSIEKNRKEVKDFIEKYNLSKVTSLTLNEIIEYISDKPKNITAKFIIESHSVMQFQEKQLSSSVSYLVKLSLIDLIRITCKSEELRNDPSILDYKNLEGQELDMSLLYDNVRGYLGDTKFNKNIIKTIEDEPEKFFMYNNGLTMTSKNITASTINAGKRFSCELKDFQIVNGGQTIRSIYKFLKEKFNEEKLSSAKVLVRIFKTEEDNELTNNIAEYTNSQNKINSINLKSISNIQIKIERFLREYGINYVRKAGDIGGLEKSNKQKNKDKIDSKKQRRVSIELLAQLLFSKMGNPDKATNQKSKLFDKYYDDIFNSNLNFDEVIEIIELYFSVFEEYNKISREVTNQKCFYVIWLIKIYNKNIEESIKIIENSLLEYKRDEQISNARKLIQKGFKEKIQNEIKK